MRNNSDQDEWITGDLALVTQLICTRFCSQGGVAGHARGALFTPWMLTCQDLMYIFISSLVIFFSRRDPPGGSALRRAFKMRTVLSRFHQGPHDCLYHSCLDCSSHVSLPRWRFAWLSTKKLEGEAMVPQPNENFCRALYLLHVHANGLLQTDCSDSFVQKSENMIPE